MKDDENYSRKNWSSRLKPVSRVIELADMIAGLWLNESGAHVKVVNSAINHVTRKRAPGLCTSLRKS